MQDGSRQKNQGITLATNSFAFEECIFLSKILTDKYNLKTSVIKEGLKKNKKIKYNKFNPSRIFTTFKFWIFF